MAAEAFNAKHNSVSINSICIAALFPAFILLPCFGQIPVTIPPHFFQPLSFEQVVRCLYLSMAGFGIFCGTVLLRVFDIDESRTEKKALLSSAGVLVRAISLNITGLRYYYQRDGSYLKEHPREDYSESVRILMGREADRT